MRACFLDLEMNQPSNNIIQVGYVIMDTDTEEVVLSKSLYTSLPAGEEITEFITELTGIHPQDISGAMTVGVAFGHLVKDMQDTQCCRHLFTWGGGDVPCLKRQAGQGYDSYVYDQFFNVKQLYQTLAIARSTSLRCGLGKALDRMGQPFQGRQHDALDDAHNTGRIYMMLLRHFKEEEL